MTRPGATLPRRPAISTLVLAAGRSRRMGDAHKLLEVLEGRTVLEWSVDAALQADLGPVLVVTGHRAPEVEALLPHGVSWVRNPDWPDGMSTSLRAGVEALEGPHDAVAVALADMPLARTSHYLALAAAWSAGRILVPTHGGTRGHPVVWPSALARDFASLEGDIGARPLLAVHEASVLEVPIDDPGVLLDVDDEAGLRMAAERLRARSAADRPRH